MVARPPAALAHVIRSFSKLSPAGQVLGVFCAVLALFSAVWLGQADERVLEQIPKRRAQGKELRLEHHVAMGFHRAAWAGLVVGVLGVMSAGWWGRRPAAEPMATESFASASVSTFPAGWIKPVNWGGVAVAAALAMTVSGVLRWPRLSHSFWSDEAYAARAYVWGVTLPKPDGSLGFKPVGWTEAFFLNERANNQVWCSIEARAAHALWRAATGAPADTFSERALRMPSFCWGLLTVGALTYLGASLGGRAGLPAGLFLAVHPWHVRFAAEMRGYSAMLLALALGLIFLMQAMRDGRWRWWCLNAATNLWALLAFAGSVHVPLVCCGSAAVCLVVKKRWSWLARLALCNAVAGVAFLWVYGPSITQLKAYLDRGTDAAAYIVDATWMGQFFESLCLGVPWSVMSESWHRASFLPSAAAAGVAMWLVAGHFLIRLAAALRWKPWFLIVPGLLTAAAGLSILQSVLGRTLLLMWYLLPVLIGWVLVLGVDPARSADSSPRFGRRAATWLGALGGIACLLIWTSSSLAMMKVPRQPMREAAGATGPGGPVRSSSALPMLAVAGISDGQMKLYRGDAITVKSLDDLTRAEEEAARSGRILEVSVGGWQATTTRSPEVIARLLGGAYEKRADFPAWEPMFSYQVWRKK